MVKKKLKTKKIDSIEIVLTKQEHDTLSGIMNQGRADVANPSREGLDYLVQLDRYKKVLMSLPDWKEPGDKDWYRPEIIDPNMESNGYFTVYVGGDIIELPDELKVTDEPKKKTKTKKEKKEQPEEGGFAGLMEEPTVSSVEEKKEERLTGQEKISEKLAGKVEKIADTLSSRRIKKLFENATKINKFVEKMKSEEKNDSIKDKSTKIDELISQQEGMVSILSKILSFMQKNYDEDKLALEEAKNFAEEGKLEKDKKFKEMLDALKAKGFVEGEEPKTEKEEEKSFLDKFGGLGSTLLNIAKFFLTNPLGIAILGGAAVLTAMLMASKESHEQAAKVVGAGDEGATGAAIQNLEGADRRKSKILREAYSKGILEKDLIGGFFDLGKKRTENENKLLKDIGFDPKTGLTQADRDRGFNFVDPETGEPMYSKFYDKEGNLKPKGEVDQTPASVPAATSTPSATTTAEPSSTTPPTPAETPGGLGEKLNSVVAENNMAKLESEMPDIPKAMSSVFQSFKDKVTGNNVAIPHVRNQEETFQRMVYNNTRVV